MKVLHLRSSQVFAGPERQILTLTPLLPDHGWEAEIAFLSREIGACSSFLEVAQAFRGQGIEVSQVSDPGPSPVPAAGSIRRLLQGGDVDLVHSHDYKANAVALLAARGLDLPLVSTVHLHTRSSRRLRLYHRLDCLLLRQFRQVILVAESLVETVPTRLARDGRLTVVENGVSLPPPHDLSRREEIRRRLGVGSGETLVLGAGRLARQKGFDVLAEAAHRLLDRLPSVTFLIAGEGPERLSLERLALDLGLGKRFRLVGFQEEMADLLVAADLVALPSRSEGTPYSLLEAMAHGRPVVASAVGGVPAVVKPGECGLLVPPEDPEALSSAIVETLADPSRCRRWGERGREIISQGFSAESMARETTAVYERALA